MKAWSLALTSGLALSCAVGIFSYQAIGQDSSFPADYADGVHYTTVNRGNIREELFTSQAAIDAARSGGDFPDGTIITMEDYRDDKLYRFVVMEKSSALVDSIPADQQAGNWIFSSYRPDFTLNTDENPARCASCHQGQADNDFVFTRNSM